MKYNGYTNQAFQSFEKKTNLPFRLISENEINLTKNEQNLLNRRRVKFKERVISFERHGIISHFLTSTPKSFEALIIRNGAAKYLPKLPSGVKEPDEFYLNKKNKTIFVIEKKTQKVIGSVDEKIQTAPFKKYSLRKKFKKG